MSRPERTSLGRAGRRPTLGRLRRRLDLLLELSSADLASKDAGTLLGYLWWFAEPALLTVVYAIVIGGILGRGGPDYPLFVLCALIPWRWTSGCVMDSLGSISARKGILVQVSTSRAFFPSAKVLAHSWRALMAFPVLVLLGCVSGIPPTLAYVWLPLILGVNLLFNWGLALVLADLGAMIKDLARAVQFVLRAWFYLSPGLYSLDSVPERLRGIMMLNPMTSLFEGYRFVVMGAGTLDLGALALVAVGSVLVGLYGFRRIQKHRFLYARVV